MTLNTPVLLYSAATSLLSAFIFGLAPALKSLRRNVSEDLHESTRSVTSGRKVRHVLVITEIALALVLVSGAGLMVRSFLRLTSADTGFHDLHAERDQHPERRCAGRAGLQRPNLRGIEPAVWQPRFRCCGSAFPQRSGADGFFP